MRLQEVAWQYATLTRVLGVCNTTSCSWAQQKPACATSDNVLWLSVQDTLLQETSARVQEWQMRCQDLRSQHEAVLTSGIGVQTMPTAVVPSQQDAQMEEATQ